MSIFISLTSKWKMHMSYNFTEMLTLRGCRGCRKSLAFYSTHGHQKTWFFIFFLNFWEFHPPNFWRYGRYEFIYLLKAPLAIIKFSLKMSLVFMNTTIKNEKIWVLFEVVAFLQRISFLIKFLVVFWHILICKLCKCGSNNLKTDQKLCIGIFTYFYPNQIYPLKIITAPWCNFLV